MAKPIFNKQPLHCCDFSAIPKEPASFSDIIAYYSCLRSYVEHEDGLINYRLTWSLTVHGFLFATFGLLAAKVVDLLVEIHKTPIDPVLVRFTFTGLSVFQFTIASFGAFVGYQSRRAIVAAHNAILHIFAIGNADGILSLESEQSRVVGVAIAPGLQTVTPSSLKQIAAKTRVLIHDPQEGREEIARVSTVIGTSFDAVFQRPHRAGASLWVLGHGLLPKLIGGGAREPHSGGAHSFYLWLPAVAMVVWCVLAAIALSVAICSWWPQGWFCRFVLHILY